MANVEYHLAAFGSKYPYGTLCGEPARRTTSVPTEVTCPECKAHMLTKGLYDKAEV